MTVLSFLLLLTPLGLALAAYILWPLLARRPGDQALAAPADPGVADPGVADSAEQQAAANRAVVAERRAQLDEEIRGLPADSPLRRQRIAEFTRAALADLEPAAATAVPASPSGRRPRMLPLIIALLVLLLAVPLIGYRIVGTPEWPGIVASRQSEERGIRDMIAEVERRLVERPDDVQGWLILGRTRLALGETAAGLSALERALAVDSPDPQMAAQIRTDLADALARGGGDLSGRPTRLVNEALARSPDLPKALALAGAFAAARGDSGQARARWQKLLTGLPAGSEQAQQVEALLAQLPGTSGPNATEPGAIEPAATGPSAAPPATGADPAPAGPRLTGRVVLDPGLMEQARADDTVFIVARGLNGNDEAFGPPLAVLRVHVADLPYDFVLDESTAMTPTATLAHQPRVRIVARISRSGSARPAPGDIEGSSAPVAHDASGVTVRLDRPIP